MTGQELKALRNALGLSVTKASRQVEVSARTWQRWESGTQSIPEGAVKLFRLLNKDEEALLKYGVLPQCTDGTNRRVSGSMTMQFPCQLRSGHEGPHDYSWKSLPNKIK